MSKPRIRIYLEVDTVAHGNTIKQAIQDQLAGKDLFDTISFGGGVGIEDSPTTVWGIAEFRFNSRADRDTVTTWIKDQVHNHPQVKNWVTKAVVTTHLCTHDDVQIQPCTTTEYLEWTR